MAELLHGVEERAAPCRPQVLPCTVLGPPGADMELIDDQIAEGRRPPSLVVPGIGGGIAHEAEALGKCRRDRQLACERIALPAGAAGTIDEEHVRLPVAQPGKEA